MWTTLVLALVLLAWALSRTLSPSPPRTLTMSTGATDGAYHALGLKYQAFLKREGITLTLQTSSGSVENLKRLQSGTADVALVQGGLGLLAQNPMADPDDTPLRSLATVTYEPVWIFSSASSSLNLNAGLGALAGKRVAVGVAGSGNQTVALALLAAYGVTDAQGTPVAGTTLVTEGGLSAAARLQAHTVDALILVAAPQAPAVLKLLADPTLQLASLRHAEGLTRRLPYFQTVSLKAGSVNPQANLPANDVTLLTTIANLVIPDSLHPALAYLLLEAAHQIHSAPSLLNRAGEFPSARAPDFPLADEAERYFQNGRPFLQRYLPFWLANLVQRLVLMLLPLLALLVPMFKLLPWVMSWKQQRRLYRRYGELKFLERDISARTLTAAELAHAREQLDHIERDVLDTRFPLDFSDRVYTLRQHVDFVRDKLAGHREN